MPASLAAKAGLSGPQWASYTGMTFTAGTIAGYVGFGFLADAFGRKPTTLLFMVLSLILTPLLFFWTTDLKMVSAGRRIVGMLFVRPIHVDVDMAAGALPNPRARDRRRLHIQCGTNTCRVRRIDCGYADRQIRRLW